MPAARATQRRRRGRVGPRARGSIRGSSRSAFLRAYIDPERSGKIETVVGLGTYMTKQPCCSNAAREALPKRPGARALSARRGRKNLGWDVADHREGAREPLMPDGSLSRSLRVAAEDAARLGTTERRARAACDTTRRRSSCSRESARASSCGAFLRASLHRPRGVSGKIEQVVGLRIYTGSR
jgi:hypothetical protein